MAENDEAPSSSMQANPRPTLPWRVAIVYAVVAGAWILGSDHLLAELPADPDDLVELGTMKGIFFVGVSGLWFFAWAYLRERDARRLAVARQHEREEAAAPHRAVSASVLDHTAVVD